MIYCINFNFSKVERYKGHIFQALACQRAEHDFAGVPCGIMDQFISVMGKEGHALLLDCRDLSIKQIPISQINDYVFLITNSNAPHKLSSSAYCKRRDCCYEAAKRLNKGSLREVSISDIQGRKRNTTTLKSKIIYVIITFYNVLYF